MNQIFTEPAIQAAMEMIENREAGLIVLQEEQQVFTAQTPGIRAALWLHDECPAILRGAVIVDRIIGRAAAMIFADGGVRAVYGSVMSKTAQQELEAKGIATQAGSLVEAVINRQGTGICPMEQAVLGIETPELALPRLRDTVALLMAAYGEKKE